jgi:hypothetical protein
MTRAAGSAARAGPAVPTDHILEALDPRIGRLEHQVVE